MPRSAWPVVRIPLGVAAGLALTFALVVGVEAFSAVVHPVPEGFDGSMETTCEHVRNYPAWVLAVAIILWGGAAGAGTAVAALVAAALGLNISMLPYPWWFSAGAAIAVLAAMLPSLRRVA
jgi:hypothetical protein